MAIYFDLKTPPSFQNLPLDPFNILHERISSSTVRTCHLNTLKWLNENKCAWDEWSMHAATTGQLETLKWLRAAGFPWDEWSCLGAVDNGQLEMLKWLKANGCPWNKYVCLSTTSNPLIRNWILWN